MIIIDAIRDYYFKKKWSYRNKHNKTEPVCRCPMELISIGNNTYGKIYVQAFSTNYYLKIGNYCSVGPKVSFILSAEHKMEYMSTYPYKVKILGEKYEAVSKGDIIVKDDVWIGYGSTILSGVTIGQGAVIAAGAVVAADVPPYAIVGGVPAKVIDYRFSATIIDFLLTLDYGALTNDLIKMHIDDFYKSIDGMQIDYLKNNYKWFPKKNI